jgi:hypothetical protein
MQWLKNRMKGQDNRATAHPIYFVQEKFVVHIGGESKVIGYHNVQPFFSNEGAEKFIRENEHNLNGPMIYVASGWNNDEWKAIRSILVGEGKDN